jgi:hypothetical protein
MRQASAFGTEVATFSRISTCPSDPRASSRAARW